MPNGEDWLEDPLMENRDYRKLKSSNVEQYEKWRIFHYATSLKLNGANFFCTKVIDTACTSEDVQLEWYLDAFFFELMAACDTLLQEVNTVYTYDLQLKLEAVRWNKIKGKLPNELVKYVEEERKKEWFDKVRRYRNMATHHSYLWTGSMQLRAGDKPWDYTNHDVSIYHLDRTGELKRESYRACPTYLGKMVGHIQQVWKEMAQEFQ